MPKRPDDRPSAEDVFAEALDQEKASLTRGGLRLLLSGYEALRAFRARPVNENELVSIRGMIAYVAFAQNVTEESVAAVLTARYDVPAIDALPSALYPDIIEFLVDLDMAKILN